MQLSAGHEFGPYEIVAPLGAGGMGEVYRACDRRLGRDVALKILPPEVAADPVRRQRFEFESRAVAALNHPNIVAVYDVGDGYFVSELVNGEPLLAIRRSLRKVIETAVQIANALAAAHEAGIVHRDLKPANILLTRDGHPKILDFGLAKMRAAPGAASMETATMRTQPGTVLGTPNYMSPEQVRGAAVDHRSDVFSFGVILYELLAPSRPFEREMAAETMTAILRQDPPDLPDTVPPLLRAIVARCLEKNPVDRFQSARDLAFALSQAGMQSASGDSRPEPRAGVKAWTRIALAAAIVLTTAIAGARWVWLRPAPQWSGVILGGPAAALNPRLSPHGDLLAFKILDRGLSQVALMKPESGNWSILTRRRDRGEVQQVSWSADGSLIYYDRLSDVPVGVYTVPVLGGEERQVLERASSPEALPDGSVLLTRLNAQGESQVYRFWPETGALKEFPLARPPKFAPACSRIAPGGKQVLTYAWPVGGREGPALYGIDLASNAVHRLATFQQASSDLQAWTVGRDGTSVFAALTVGSMTRIVEMPIGAQSPKTLFTVTSPVWYIEGAADSGLFVNLVDRPKALLSLSPKSGGTPETLASFALGANPDQVLLLPDGRAVTPASALGRLRLMAAEKGKDPVPLVITQEETAAPMTLAGAREIAFVIGPAPHNTIALADIATGRITRRLTPGRGAINCLTATQDGSTLFFCAGGSVFALSSSGGEARPITTGEFAAMDKSSRRLIVVRGESSHIRMFRVPLDGGTETEISLDPSVPLYGVHGGYFSSGSIDGEGRVIVSLSPVDSWFNPLGLLAADTGRITRVAVEGSNDYHSGVWTPDGRIVAGQVGMRAVIWRFRPLDR